MPLESLLDLAPVDWIHEGRDKPTEKRGRTDWPGVSVRHCVPSKFPSYAKVFHPIYTDPPSRGRIKGKRVLWRELAQRFSLEFHPEINASFFAPVSQEGTWIENLIGPDKGHLDEDTCGVLIDTLERFTGQHQCWFYYTGISISGYEPRLYHGDIQDIIGLTKLDGAMAPPEYWWPDDRSWCIYSDWDLTFTIVAGPSELIRLCADNSALEAVPVTASTRVDDLADRPNARRRIRQAAELLLANQMSLSLAARVLIGLQPIAGGEFDTDLVPFVAIEYETRFLPIGPVRAEWAPEVLSSIDQEILRIESTHRAGALEACRNMLLKVSL